MPKEAVLSDNFSHSVGNFLLVFLFEAVMATMIKWLQEEWRKAGPQKDMMPVDKTSLGSAALSLVLWSTWVYFRSDMRQPDKQNELLTAFLSLACGMMEGAFFYGPHC